MTCAIWYRSDLVPILFLSAFYVVSISYPGLMGLFYLYYELLTLRGYDIVSLYPCDHGGGGRINRGGIRGVKRS